MNIILIIVIVVLAALVLISLVRGLIAFIQMTEQDLKTPGVGRSHQMQNKMMFARVKYQALAIIAVAVLMMVNR
ncbi:hypothetical protein [Blastomonas sp.]|uniref:hypothetical protein n=1 Tax=Blastomonas sp. TaxID=1909299 RepID=UPI00359481F5